MIDERQEGRAIRALPGFVHWSMATVLLLALMLVVPVFAGLI